MFLIFHDFQVSCHIPRPTVDISKFSTFFSFLAIFQVLQCAFLIFHVFQWFRNFSSRQVDVSHFPWFSGFLPYSRSYSVHLSFFSFFRDFVIFQVTKWMFLYFHYFQFPAIFHVLQWTFLNYPTFSVFLALFHVLKCVFLIFWDFQVSRHIPGPTVSISHFSPFAVISWFFKSSSGCFSFSKIFSFLAIFPVLEWTF